VGIYLRDAFKAHFKDKGKADVKYIDPSYLIR
jgi:hypothetical protein